MASGLTRNQVPRKGLRVRVPCPPLLACLTGARRLTSAIAHHFRTSFGVIILTPPLSDSGGLSQVQAELPPTGTCCLAFGHRQELARHFGAQAVVVLQPAEPLRDFLLRGLAVSDELEHAADVFGVVSV